ncbi:ammonium transporter [Pygmaiobacter massiliensis]|uniref:ammonium transporter n=1 Tax=Pygmaiobacter massiliensis TaxID=1917873 RepID=UPI000C7AA33D|nr:ammonium transporter [Pygmaiobacter massiliensis]
MYSAIDTVWVLLGTTLVFFMQAGFAMVETGFTRAKNAGNIIMKNLMDFACGTVVYWVLGFGLMYGSTELLPGLLGNLSVAWQADTRWTDLIFQTVFCATAATIVSGAMAERTNFKAYLLYSIAISAVVYPVSGHWIWGGGWLSTLGTAEGLLPRLGAYGFHDFAGSTAVHMVGGLSALIGAKILGPRIGKYNKDGSPNAIPGHSLTLGALGVFILWFGWFGFNPASSLGVEGLEANVGRIFVTTNMAAAVATCTVMVITWVRYGKPDVSMTLNGSLAGLVAITAGCSTVTVTGSAVIGLLAGWIVVFGIEFVDRKLKIDDPVGAVGVHCLCGGAGTILVGVFAYFDPYTDSTVLQKGQGLGLIYGGGTAQLLVQVLGVAAVALWVTVTMNVIFRLIDRVVGLRVSEEEEIDGLDLHEHGLISAYADFMPVSMAVNENTNLGNDDYISASPAAIEAAIPVMQTTSYPADSAQAGRITNVVILCRQTKFEALKTALNDLGITGLTLTHVQGCGIQKGGEYYRGVPQDMNLLPRVKVEVVVSQVPVADVIETAKRVLYTGHTGDGKIFVYDVQNVVKIRTGEIGVAALQDVE